MRRGVKLALSVAAGLAAMVLALGYGSSVRAGAEQERQEVLAAYGGELVSVCVATREIDAGETLDEGNVQVEEWVASLLPADAVTSMHDVLGKRATSSIPARAVLCPVYFEARDGGLEVPEDLVAVSVPVDAAHAVGGAVAPGDEVDVYLSGSGVASSLCAARVLASSAQRDDAASLSWVTIAVEPERVAELLSATSAGSVSLVVPGSGVRDSAPARQGEVTEGDGRTSAGEADSVADEGARADDEALSGAGGTGADSSKSAPDADVGADE